MIFNAMIIEGGNAFVMMPAVTMGANSLPDELVPHGTAVITTVRQVLGSTGVAVATLILTNATSHALSNGFGKTAANIHGYRMVFITMVVVEVIGWVLALMMRDTKKASQSAK